MSVLAQVGFVALSACVLALPLLGMLRALQRPGMREADPPPRPVQTLTQASIERFRHNLQEEFGSLLALLRDDEAVRGSSKRGVPFLLLGQKRHLTEQLPPSARVLRQWVVAARHLDIPGELACERPLHAEGRLSLAHNASVRTAHARNEIVIGPRARVRQWAHGGIRVEAAEGALLHGVVSAGREIVLARQVRFTHLDAPHIRFGRSMTRAAIPPRPTLEMDAPSHARVSLGVWHVQGDMTIPAACLVRAELIVTGRLVMGKGSRVEGSVHVQGDVYMDEQASIEGSLFGDQDVALGEACQIDGPLQASGRLSLDACCEVGLPGEPTTVSAHRLYGAESAVVHGAVHARYSGEVVLDIRDRA